MRRWGVVLVLSLGAAACSEGGSDGFPDEFTVMSALEEIPSSLALGVDTRIRIADIDAVSDLTGIERDVDLDVAGLDVSPWETVLDVGTAERDGAREVIIPVDIGLIRDALYEEAAVVTELGWSFEDVDAFVSVYTSEADFDVAALRAETVTLPDPDADGIIRIGEGEDGTYGVSNRTQLRPLGRPLRMAIDDRSVVVVSRETPPVVDWRDGNGTTWADDADLALAAAALDRDDDLYAANLIATSVTAADREPLADGVDRWAVYGVSWSGIGESQRTTAVFVFDDLEQADRAYEPLRSMLVDFGEDPDGGTFEIDTIDLDGRAVIVTGSSIWGPAG